MKSAEWPPFDVPTRSAGRLRPCFERRIDAPVSARISDASFRHSFGVTLLVCGGSECIAQLPPVGTQSPIPAVERPTNLPDLLRNARRVLEDGSLVRDDFDEDDVLLQYFGGTKYRPSKKDNELYRRTWISGSGNKFSEPLQLGGGGTARGISLSLDRVRDSGGRQTWILSLFYIPGQRPVDFDAVTAIFGSNWQPVEFVPSPHRMLPVPERPHGDSTILYSGTTGWRSWRISPFFKRTRSLKAPTSWSSSEKICYGAMQIVGGHEVGRTTLKSGGMTLLAGWFAAARPRFRRTLQVPVAHVGEQHMRGAACEIAVGARFEQRPFILAHVEPAEAVLAGDDVDHHRFFD